MKGNLIYRYNLDQLELEGHWSLNNDVLKERFSYLFLKKCEKVICPIKIKEIENFNSFKNNDFNYNSYHQNFFIQGENTNNNENKIEKLDPNYVYRDEYHLSICSANLFEAMTISHPLIFDSITNYLSGEYHGFFVYYDKTIEDRFYINFNYDENQVRINGKLETL